MMLIEWAIQEVPINNKTTAMQYLDILKKLRKAFNNRIDKSFMASVIDDFIKKHDLPTKTYKSRGIRE